MALLSRELNKTSDQAANKRSKAVKEPKSQAMKQPNSKPKDQSVSSSNAIEESNNPSQPIAKRTAKHQSKQDKVLTGTKRPIGASTRSGLETNTDQALINAKELRIR